ncbi:hypothetical protein CKY39_07820 [Variovorax boronicumulans]|uniref:Uncharacterized protein n=1 Tax=Variovorax boronicumulans TaxID=436515 RepID=A0A250DFJ1_9BURK|nr:hypothetical protein [Variovorax boronicumulans]ATA53128.1 hypothetical protein CKY39_07820 [Variovorax boronicumulans]
MLDKHIHKAHLALGALLATLGLAAPAAEGRWSQGFGQGNLEYFIDAQGMQLLIGCPTQEGSANAASSVILVSTASSQEVKKFTVKVGAHTFEGPFEADSRAGENNFIGLLNDLRKSDATVSYGGKTITFPKSNAAQILPVYGKKGFQCNLG